VDPSNAAALHDLVIGDLLGAEPVRVQALVLALLLGSTLWAAARPRVLPGIGLLACAAMWARTNQRLEGGVLLTLAPGRGLTAADLLIPAALVLVAVRAVRATRRARLEPLFPPDR
jgi:hypothetical protein